MADRFLPYGRQFIDDDDVRAVSEALRSDYLTTGPRVEAFETAFAEKVGASFAVACSNGTAGLHLAAMAAGVSAGDWSIVPSQTFLATANASRFCGADVWFTDVDPDRGLMRAGDFETALRRCPEGRAKAVWPVHLNGHLVDMEAVSAMARKHGLWVIEDACHSIGTRYRAGNGALHRVGDCQFSDMTVFSLHPVKTLTSGEGGVVTTNDGLLAQVMRDLRSHGMTRDVARFERSEQALDGSGNGNPWYYEMQALGYNYRITDIQCALGLSQLGKLDRFCAKRRSIRKLYDERVAPLAPTVRPVVSDPGLDPVLHLYAVLVDFPAMGMERAEFMARLREFGVGTQVHYVPVSQQPYYRALYGEMDLPGAQRYYERVLSLPFYPSLADTDVEHVVASIERIVG